jgi:catechol 2,3-dioxygenase-like lactoylglutathione lyase family enzyme
MTARLAHVTFDATDPNTLAAFWSTVLDRPVDPYVGENFASIGGNETDAQLAFFFIRVPEGKTAKNRCHPDLMSADRETEVGRVVGLGAERIADHDEFGARWTVLRDPQGNEFCIGSE